MILDDATKHRVIRLVLDKGNKSNKTGYFYWPA